MADNVLDQITPEATSVVPEQQQPIDHSAELAAQMAIALNGGIEPKHIQEQNSDPANTGEPAANDGAAVAQSENDPFGIFKERFGYDTPETAIKEIEELRAFREQPRVPQFEVADDESGAILRALAAGKREEVWKILDHDLKVNRLISAEVTKENAPEIVKMGMQLKYKDLTPDEINYRFNKQFSFPQKPSQSIDEDDADYQQRVDAWQEQVNDKQMELMIEAKLAKPEIQNAKSNLEFPEIETPVDEGYIQYQKMLEERAQNDAVVKAAYSALTPEALETKIPFKDEANKVAFEFQFKPDSEKFKKIVEIASDSGLFWKTFMNSDGTPNRQLFLDSIIYALDKNSILMAAMNQAKNATIKAQLPDNSQGGLTRQIPQTQEPNELHQYMQAALSGYGPFK